MVGDFYIHLPTRATAAAAAAALAGGTADAVASGAGAGLNEINFRLVGSPLPPSLPYCPAREVVG